MGCSFPLRWAVVIPGMVGMFDEEAGMDKGGQEKYEDAEEGGSEGGCGAEVADYLEACLGWL